MLFSKQIRVRFFSNSEQSGATSPSSTPLRVVGLVLTALSISVISSYGASWVSPTDKSTQITYSMVCFFNTLSSFIQGSSYIFVCFVCTLAFAAISALSWVGYFMRKAGLTRLLDSAANSVLTDAQGAVSFDATRQSLVSSFDRDLDFFSSTDFEDLLVFTLDVLELLWQDLNLLIELCGDNVFFAGLGLGSAGLSWALRRVFSTKRFKK